MKEYHGMTGGSVKPGSYTDFKITFPDEGFYNVPSVSATLSTNTGWASAYANISVNIMDLTKKGMTVRVFNGYTGGTEPYFTWSAIGI